jgi:hypothetical protein
MEMRTLSEEEYLLYKWNKTADVGRKEME